MLHRPMYHKKINHNARALVVAVRVNQRLLQTTFAESSAPVENTTEVQPESAPVTEAVDEAGEAKKKSIVVAANQRLADDAQAKVTGESPRNQWPKNPQMNRLPMQLKMARKPKRGRGRGRRHTPEAVPESATAPQSLISKLNHSKTALMRHNSDHRRR